MSWERRELLYWRRRGQTYEAAYIQTPDRQAQEAAIRLLVADLTYVSVLDVGCGFGRIGALLGPCHYTGIDLSSVMLASARLKLPQGRFVRSSLERFDPGHQYDLVLAVEVLMHHTPSKVAESVAQLRALARSHLVTVDWSRPLPDGGQDSHNWVHDYRELYGDALVSEVPVGYQSVYHVRP